MDETGEKKKKGRPKKNNNNDKEENNTKNNNSKTSTNSKSHSISNLSINDDNTSNNKKQILNNESNNTEKKKRGRKKKKVDEVKIKKKRGRKAALKYFSSSIRKQISLKTNIVDNENNILFLDIQEDNIIEENQTETNTFINLKDINDNDITNRITSVLNNENENNITEIVNAMDTMHLNDNATFNNMLIFNDYTQDTKDTSDDFITRKSEKTSCNSSNNSNSYSKNENSISSISIKNDLLENDIIIQKDNIKKGYFQMFNYFEDWVEKTNIKCWWCCHYFDTLPIGCPVKYDSKINKFRVKGIFCSFACMLAYARNTKGIEYKQYLIKFLYKKLTGSQYDDILYKEAPSRYTLKEFGGHLTIDEFRKLSNEHTFYKMIEYPMYESRDYIAEVDILNIKQVNDKIFKNEKNKIILDDKKIQEVKQRISKIDQTVTISNSIENFIKN